MEVVRFLNLREIGNPIVNYGSYRHKKASKPNLDDVISRLACREDNVYMSEGEGLYVPPFACKFRRDNHNDLLAVANEDGVVCLIDTEKKSIAVNAYTAHNNAIYDICWLPNKSHLITVSGDQAACLWDMNTFQIVSTFKRHRESIKSVDVCPRDNAIFATGSRDGSICVWDTRDKSGNARDKPSIQINNSHCRKKANVPKGKKSLRAKNNLSSVSAVAFQDDINLASVGVADGLLKIWNLRKSYISGPTYIPKASYQMKCSDDKNNGHGCTSLVFDSNYKKLYASSTANKIYMFDCHTYSETDISFEGLKCDTYYIKLALSADDQYLACGSSDNKAYVWKTSQPGLPSFEFSGHSSEVTTVAWGYQDVSKFVTCGDDNKIMVWKTVNDETTQQYNDVVSTANKYENLDSATGDSPSSPSVVSQNNSSTFIDGNLAKWFSVLPQSNSSSVNNNSHQSSFQNDPAHLTDTNTPSSSSTKSQNNSPTVFKTPKMKSIRSFFQPVTSVASPLDLTVNSKSDCESSSRTSPAQVLSPSKLVNRNINESPDTSVLSTKPEGKENQFWESSTGQAKRRSSNEFTPDTRKSTKRGRHNSTSSSGKKTGSPVDIRNYFISHLSPEEE